MLAAEPSRREEHLWHLAGLLRARPGDADEPPVGRLGGPLGPLATPPRSLGYGPPQTLGAPGAVAELLPALAQKLLRLAHQPTQNPHPVVEQSAIGRVADVGLDHRGVGPELPAARHLALTSQLDRPLVEPF